eukprot:2893214-Rhodomonas_salina.1
MDVFQVWKLMNFSIHAKCFGLPPFSSILLGVCPSSLLRVPPFLKFSLLFSSQTPPSLPPAINGTMHLNYPGATYYVFA